MAQNFEVLIAGMAFDQQDITISAGDTVTWINDDSTTTHSVTKDPTSPLPFTEVIVPGGTYTTRQSFPTVGVLNYHCKFHSHMTGSVTVQ